ncbi:MAG: hypothetical protein U0670_11815 [Anaerolineae bacterium]
MLKHRVSSILTVGLFFFVALFACRCDVDMLNVCAAQEHLDVLPTGGLGWPHFFDCMDRLDIACPIPVNNADIPAYEACVVAAANAYYSGQPIATHTYPGQDYPWSFSVTGYGTPSPEAPNPAPPQPPVSAANCSALALTSPLDGLPNGTATFYWNPLPGNHTYRLVISDASSNTNLLTLVTALNAYTTSADVSQGAIGGGYQLRVSIQALNGTQAICTDAHVLNRAAPNNGGSGGGLPTLPPPPLPITPTPNVPR